MKILYIVRGLPGSGKTTLANKLSPEDNYSADDFFVNEGEYVFDAARLGEAHGSCYQNVRRAMEDQAETIAVHNTFSQPWEAEKYFLLARTHGYQVFVVECQNKFQNVHGVEQRQMDNMRSRWLPLL